ncbi:PREDICTED: ephrin-B3-like [Ceratosolen solmsi marchali]|uniref:Ephrin-B3-like n=1 Tax=Ceratosolen solmsi marchali TaxID=326594 RepID=A0AAJ6YHN7_9HYME|nr:PREDICTED: ephrin-B3-like [Ceratosolen solmsi marchali]
MVSTSIVTLVFLVCLQTVLLSTVSNCAKTISMYWNTTNSIFRIDNTDHIIDVNKNNAAFEYDQVNIICPVYQPGTYDDEAEKYIIYNVSKEEYETCRITNPSPRVIAICDKPFRTMYFTITFRPFTPQPGGLEFHPGRDYYFISTSSKDDLHRRIGGRCTTHNMKVVFKVCCNNEGDSSFYPATSRNNSVGVTSSSTMSSSGGGIGVGVGGGGGGLGIGVGGGGVNGGSGIGGSGSGIGGGGGGGGSGGGGSAGGSGSSGNTAILNGNNGGAISPALPPSIYKGGDRFYPGNVHHGHDHGQHQPTDQGTSPGLSHVPQQPMFPNYPHQQPQPPMYPGPPASQPPKTSITQKKKNKEYSDHPNEVVKNEELTYNGASSPRLRFLIQEQQLAWTLALLCGALLPHLLR